MQIILRADIDNLGRLGDTVKVKPGYARNFLIPHGLAMPATQGNLKLFEQERKKLQARMDALRASAGDLAARIGAVELVISMRVGENDKLYGSVTSALIADALLEKGIEIDRRRILLDAPIRTLGEFQVRARLHADVVTEFTVTVAPEERYHADEPVQAEPQSEPAAE